jgi:hypothetical protein
MKRFLKMPGKVKKTEFKKVGQKKPTPPKGDPLRTFYTSLLMQKKDSEMALKWCLEHGLLGPKKAELVHAQFQLASLKIK